MKTNEGAEAPFKTPEVSARLRSPANNDDEKAFEAKEAEFMLGCEGNEDFNTGAQMGYYHGWKDALSHARKKANPLPCGCVWEEEGYCSSCLSAYEDWKKSEAPAPSQPDLTRLFAALENYRKSIEGEDFTCKQPKRWVELKASVEALRKNSQPTRLSVLRDVEELKKYLLNREGDIAMGEEDFGNLRGTFELIIGRKPKEVR